MRLGLRTGLGTILMALATVPLACSGKVASSGGSANGSGSGSNSGSGGGSSSSGVIGGSGTGSGGGSGGSGSGGSGVVPPNPPQGPTTMLTASHDYALHRLFLGDTDRQGVTNPDAWKGFGYDLDAKITTAASTDVCTLVAGASRSVQIDGNGGIDNSWGSNRRSSWTFNRGSSRSIPKCPAR